MTKPELIEKTIAVIMTVHNRKDTTIDCLRRLYSCRVPQGVRTFVYLMDDGSTDGTREALLQEFPDVIVLQGNGNLFWNQGMRAAWKEALKHNHDFYLWLNDDTELLENALEELYEVYNQLPPLSIVTGQLSDRIGSNSPTYGGKINGESFYPTGKPEKCETMAGNVVLVPQVVVNKIGILSNFYSHQWGDYDYGAIANKRGVGVYSTRCLVGACDRKNVKRGKWCDPKYSLKERFRFFRAPSGPTPLEYAYFSFRTKPFKKALLCSILGNWNNFKKFLFAK